MATTASSTTAFWSQTLASPLLLLSLPPRPSSSSQRKPIDPPGTRSHGGEVLQGPGVFVRVRAKVHPRRPWSPRRGDIRPRVALHPQGCGGGKHTPRAGCEDREEGDVAAARHAAPPRRRRGGLHASDHEAPEHHGAFGVLRRGPERDPRSRALPRRRPLRRDSSGQEGHWPRLARAGCRGGHLARAVGPRIHAQAVRCPPRHQVRERVARTPWRRPQWCCLGAEHLQAL
mmetsp:Transcript_123157/g.307538  ORF Transcript_123157/g.307538 Transcript_123157/m.307538 type:complete len:230 (-) Transcript_123157:256-945(-)